MTDSHHIPLSTIERETQAVRRCLRKYGRRLQQQGEIPPEVSPVEIDDVMERHVPSMLQALHRSPIYPHLREKGPRHLEGHLWGIISEQFSKEFFQAPAVADDQVFYINRRTGATLSPTWRHRGCGGTVYPTDGSTFACHLCKKAGQLVALLPEELSKTEQMEYLLTDIEEVDLN